MIQLRQTIGSTVSISESQGMIILYKQKYFY